MKNIFFALILWFLLFANIAFCFLSFIYFEQKRVINRFLIFFGFNLLLLKIILQFSFRFIYNQHSILFRVNPLLDNIGVLIIFIGFALYVFSNSESELK
jgi:hypothetical protein